MDTCCDGGKEIMLLACSGGSNVGQLSNQAVLELDREGFGKMFCLAGIGGHLSGFIQSAQDVPELVAIDGCPTGCAKAILDHLEIAPTRYVVVTELGIGKAHHFDLVASQVETVKKAAREGTAGSGAGTSEQGAPRCGADR